MRSVSFAKKEMDDDDDDEETKIKRERLFRSRITVVWHSRVYSIYWLVLNRIRVCCDCETLYSSYLRLSRNVWLSFSVHFSFLFFPWLVFGFLSFSNLWKFVAKEPKQTTSTTTTRKRNERKKLYSLTFCVFKYAAHANEYNFDSLQMAKSNCNQ